VPTSFLDPLGRAIFEAVRTLVWRGRPGRHRVAAGAVPTIRTNYGLEGSVASELGGLRFPGRIEDQFSALSNKFIIRPALPRQ
jgi:hypothetical protein